MFIVKLIITNQFNVEKEDINMSMIYMEQTLNLIAAQNLEEVKALIALGEIKQTKKETLKYLIIK
jgi:hypothetical protein